MAQHGKELQEFDLQKGIGDATNVMLRFVVVQHKILERPDERWHLRSEYGDTLWANLDELA